MSEKQIEIMDLPKDCVARILTHCVDSKNFINSLLGLCQNKYTALNILGHSSNIEFTEKEDNNMPKMYVLTKDPNKIDSIKSLDFNSYSNISNTTWTSETFIKLLESVTHQFKHVVIPLFINRNVYFSGCININAKFYSYFGLSHLTHKIIEFRDKLSRMFTAATQREIDFVIKFTNKSLENNWGNMDNYWDQQSIALYYDHADLVNWLSSPENPFLDTTLSQLRKFMIDFPQLEYVNYVDALDSTTRHFDLNFDERHQTKIVIQNKNYKEKRHEETFYLSYFSALNLSPFMSIESRFKDMFLSTGKIHLQNAIFMFLWDEKRHVSHYDYLDFIHLYMIKNDKIVLHDKDNCIITLGLYLDTYLCYQLLQKIRVFLETLIQKLELEKITLVFYMIDREEEEDENDYEWYTSNQIINFISHFKSDVIKNVYLYNQLYRKGEYGDLNEKNISALKKRYL